MRFKLIAVIVSLLVGCSLPIGNVSSASQGQKVTISRHGTLLELLGTSLQNSTRKVGTDGFRLNYDTGGTTRSVSAIGMNTSGLRPSHSKPTSNDNTATAVVQTADQSLEIESEFTFDRSTKMLTIRRRFRNISRHPVTLQTIRNYIDPALVFGVKAPRFHMKRDFVSFRAGLSTDLSCFVECVPPPVCPWEEPPRCRRDDNTFFKARWDGSSPSNGILRWTDPIKLTPNKPTNEAFIVVRFVIR